MFWTEQDPILLHYVPFQIPHGLPMTARGFEFDMHICILHVCRLFVVPRYKGEEPCMSMVFFICGSGHYVHRSASEWPTAITMLVFAICTYVAWLLLKHKIVEVSSHVLGWISCSPSPFCRAFQIIPSRFAQHFTSERQSSLAGLWETPNLSQGLTATVRILCNCWSGAEGHGPTLRLILPARRLDLLSIRYLLTDFWTTQRRSALFKLTNNGGWKQTHSQKYHDTSIQKPQRLDVSIAIWNVNQPPYQRYPSGIPRSCWHKAKNSGYYRKRM